MNQEPHENSPLKPAYDSNKATSSKSSRRKLRLPRPSLPSFRREKPGASNERSKWRKIKSRAVGTLAVAAVGGGAYVAEEAFWGSKGVKYSGIEKVLVGQELDKATCLRDGLELHPGVVIRSNQGEYDNMLGKLSDWTGILKGNVVVTVGPDEIFRVKQPRYTKYEDRDLVSFRFRGGDLTPTRTGIAEATGVVDLTRYLHPKEIDKKDKHKITPYDVGSTPHGSLTIECDLRSNGETYVNNEQAAIADVFPDSFLVDLERYKESER